MKKFLVLSLLILVLSASARATDSSPVAPAKKVAAPSPSLSISGPDYTACWSRGFHDLYHTLIRNLHTPNLFYKRRFAWPSPAFMGAYLWDTAFISQAWRAWDPATANEIDRTILDFAKDGRLQHFASPFNKSPYTQPPVMTWAIWENYLWSRDRAYLAEVYPILKDYNRWLYQQRRLPNGLFFWAHSYESGIDNSPRFGTADEKFRDTTTLAAIDLCSYMVKQDEVLALIALELGKPDEAATFRQKADELRALINEKMWDAETGLYFDLDLATGQLVKIKTIASLFPLLSGIPGADRAAAVVAHVMDPAEFNTPFPLPSVALDDPTFEKDCWRGPVWINTAYMVIVGLERYGYRAEAGELAFGVADGVYRNYRVTGEFVEFYDPVLDGFDDLHRKRGNLYKRLTLGDKPKPNFAGWTALANALVIENLVGVRSGKDGLMLRPNFPARAAGTRLTLGLPARQLTIEMEVLEGGAARGTATVNGQTRQFDLPAGGEISLQ